MDSVKKLCIALIQQGKNKEEILAKMDVYFAADRLTVQEYKELSSMM